MLATAVADGRLSPSVRRCDAHNSPNCLKWAGVTMPRHVHQITGIPDGSRSAGGDIAPATAPARAVAVAPAPAPAPALEAVLRHLRWIATSADIDTTHCTGAVTRSHRINETDKHPATAERGVKTPTERDTTIAGKALSCGISTPVRRLLAMDEQERTDMQSTHIARAFDADIPP